ncbi:unnamed protein product [Closterium sp. NIES-65]|nr:unnamed protein product [Closterium sp. NIES-65]
MPGFVQGQGATTGAPESAAGHFGPTAVTSTSLPGQPVDAACITTVASGQPCVAESSLPPVAAQPGAPAGALPSAPGQPGASSGARAAGAGQPGAAAVMPASAGSQPGGDQPVPATSAVPSGPIGHALQPPNVLYLGSGQHHANVQLPLLSHRPLVHDSGAFLVADEALDNVSGLRGHTSASRGLALSGMLSGFVQGSQSVLPSPAASTSMPPSTQGGEHGEEAASRGFMGVTKKQGKDEWIARIVVDRSS